MEENKIDSRHQNISELIFNSKQPFFIPEFQREFVWDQKDIKELLIDFMEDSEDFEKETSALSGYLLGNIVLIANNDHMTVIDGQQRLTTITIIFKALQSYAKNKTKELSEYKDKWSNLSSNLPKGYSMTNDLGEFVKLKIKHDTSLPFGDFYRRLMQNQLNEDYIITNNSDKNIREIYDYVFEFIEENNLSEKQIIRFINYLMYNVYLIMTTAPSESKAFQLFEVLNDRGRALEPLDLIKNLALQSIVKNGDESIKNEFLKNWKRFSLNLEYPFQKDNRRKKISSSKFLTNYLLAMYGENVKKNNLLDFFKKKLKEWNSNNIVDFSKDLANISDIFAKLEVHDYVAFTNKHQYLMTTIYEVISVEQAKVMLMPFYLLDNESDKKSILDAVIRYVTTILFSFNQTNTIESFIPKMIKKYYENKNVKATVELINNEIKLFIDDIHTNLPSKKLENKNGIHSPKAILLYRLIEGLIIKNGNAISKSLSKHLTIEHILSQKINIDNYSEIGFLDEEEFAQYKNRIGNLTLINNTDNSSMGNKKFIEKLPHYRDDVEFLLTKKLATNLETNVKNGQDTKLVNMINSYITTPKLAKNEIHYTKKMIDLRSNEITNLIMDFITDSLKFE
ncbi:DUF262 domain-containing protein [Staphylococcus succinus]|uniref:DUF262 domain-containing protein n=1 Tax=Staphylococcus succinus TaxID=61015 RepID=UPI002DB83752|nr:DUF262 domain-containing HNH endonuclease family protein [Staphylococcus succinus]MEB8127621.1 DUF262 domain-containing HNH endonuclease family protein [Staphylococcus succinus]